MTEGRPVSQGRSAPGWARNCSGYGCSRACPDQVAQALGVSQSTISRIERGLIPADPRAGSRMGRRSRGQRGKEDARAVPGRGGRQ